MKWLARERVQSSDWLQAQIDELDDFCPNWREIVGQVDADRQAIECSNPFRRWLATKGTAYRARVEETNSAVVILRAIELFQQETKRDAAA